MLWTPRLTRQAPWALNNSSGRRRRSSRPVSINLLAELPGSGCWATREGPNSLTLSKFIAEKRRDLCVLGERQRAPGTESRTLEAAAPPWFCPSWLLRSGRSSGLALSQTHLKNLRILRRSLRQPLSRPPAAPAPWEARRGVGVRLLIRLAHS